VLEAVSGDEALLITAARDFARAELMGRDREWDRGNGDVTDVLVTLAEMGFMNLVIAESLGGCGCTYRAYSRIIKETAYASPSAAVTLAVHNMVGLLIEKHGPAEHKREWLAGWGRRENLSAFAISEAGAGSDPGSTITKAARDSNDYVISGEKMWITNGMTARWFVTLVRTEPGHGKDELSMVMIDGSLPGVGRDVIHGKMGIRGSETAVIALDDVRVPQSWRLGDEGDGLRVSLATLNGGRIGIAAQAVGIAQACLDEMIQYAGERHQFDQPIGRFQGVQTMIADSAVDVAAASALVEHAATTMDRGATDASAASKAKLFATEAANRVAYRAVQVFGGMGYVNECRVEQLYRDARITTIYEGTSEIQRVIIARELLRSALGDAN